MSWQTWNTEKEWLVRDPAIGFTLCACEDEDEADAVVAHLGDFALQFEPTDGPVGRRVTQASRAEAIDLLCEIAPYAWMPTPDGWQSVRDLWFAFGTMGEPLRMAADVQL